MRNVICSFVLISLFATLSSFAAETFPPGYAWRSKMSFLRNDNGVILDKGGYKMKRDVEWYVISMKSYDIKIQQAILEKLQESASITAADLEKIAGKDVCEIFSAPKLTAGAGVSATVSVAQPMRRPLYCSSEDWTHEYLGLMIDFQWEPTAESDYIATNMTMKISNFLGFPDTRKGEYPLISSRVLLYSAPIQEGKFYALPMSDGKGEANVFFFKVSKIRDKDKNEIPWAAK